MVPYPLLHLCAHLLPVVEMVIGLALILGLLATRRGPAGRDLTRWSSWSPSPRPWSAAWTSPAAVSTPTAATAVGWICCGGTASCLLLCLPPLLARDPGSGLDRFLRK